MYLSDHCVIHLVTTIPKFQCKHEAISVRSIKGVTNSQLLDQHNSENITEVNDGTNTKENIDSETT